MASYTVNFTDGSSHTYDNVPETVTEDQVRARANDDYADKEVDHIAGGMPTPSATSANPELGPSIAEKVLPLHKQLLVLYCMLYIIQ